MTTYIRRAPKGGKENPYFLDLREGAQDKTISYEASGMLRYLLSKPDDWKVQPKDLERKGCGKDKVYAILKELRSVRYIVYEQTRGKKGKMGAGTYFVYETPQPLPEKPDAANPDLTEYRSTESFDSSYEESKAPAPNDADGAPKTSECDVPVSSPPQESQTKSVPAPNDQKEEEHKRTRRETPLDATVKAIIRAAWGKNPDDEVIRKRYWRRAAALRKVLANECGDWYTLRPAYIEEFYADWAKKNPNMSLPTSSLKLPGIFGEWWDEFKAQVPDNQGCSPRVFTHERLPWATFQAVRWLNWRLYLAEEPGALLPTIIVFDKGTGTEVKEEKKSNPNGEQSESHTGRDGPVLRDGGTPAAQSGPEGQVSGVHQGVHGDGPRPGQLREATGTVSGNVAGSDPAHP